MGSSWRESFWRPEKPHPDCLGNGTGPMGCLLSSSRSTWILFQILKKIILSPSLKLENKNHLSSHWPVRPSISVRFFQTLRVWFPHGWGGIVLKCVRPLCCLSKQGCGLDSAWPPALFEGLQTWVVSEAGLSHPYSPWALGDCENVLRSLMHLVSC